MARVWSRMAVSSWRWSSRPPPGAGRLLSPDLGEPVAGQALHGRLPVDGDPVGTGIEGERLEQGGVALAGPGRPLEVLELPHAPEVEVAGRQARVVADPPGQVAPDVAPVLAEQGGRRVLGMTLE